MTHRLLTNHRNFVNYAMVPGRYSGPYAVETLYFCDHLTERFVEKYGDDPMFDEQRVMEKPTLTLSSGEMIEASTMRLHPMFTLGQHSISETVDDIYHSIKHIYRDVRHPLIYYPYHLVFGMTIIDPNTGNNVTTFMTRSAVGH